MMLSMIRQACRGQLADNALLGNYTFSDEQLDGWINAAVLDLSLHFPRQASATLALQPGVQVYALESDFLAALQVASPAGQVPPCLLRRDDSSRPDFWLAPGRYDVVRRMDAGPGGEAQLVLSDPPAAGQAASVEYLAEHRPLSSPSDITTLLDRHAVLIPAYVRWKAWQALSTRGGMNPDQAPLLGSTPEANALRAEQAYRAALQAAQAAEGESRVLAWRLDKWDRGS